ncbi:MAG: ferritin-like domain-containing protein [Burkholderiaceae bacterium]
MSDSESAVGEMHNPSRRQMVRVMLQSAAAVPLMGAALGAAPAGANAAGSQAEAPASDVATVIRDFSDPYLELLRLLTVAAEIEHGLMVQYLYAAFSVKPVYRAVAGHGAPNTNDLIGIAVQEMQHLGKVNQLLVALGASPVMIREDFPFEPDIIPFRLRLEPMSRASLGRYVWCESPPGATDVHHVHGAEDLAFCRLLEHVLGKEQRPNFVGNLYDAVMSAVNEVAATKDASLPDVLAWLPALQEIKSEGELGHFQFFKRTFLGKHEGFGGRPDPWMLPASDPLYPAFQLPVDPTAYIGHQHQILDPAAQRLAWLGNLHYWVVLNLLSLGYSVGSQDMVALSRGHMMVPFQSLARQLAQMGSGMPFDPLGQGYLRSVKNGGSLRFLRRLLDEADRLEAQIGKGLPSDYAVGFCKATSAALGQLEPVLRTARAPTQPWDDGLG